MQAVRKAKVEPLMVPFLMGLKGPLAEGLLGLSLSSDAKLPATLPSG